MKVNNYLTIFLDILPTLIMNIITILSYSEILNWKPYLLLFKVKSGVNEGSTNFPLFHLKILLYTSSLFSVSQEELSLLVFNSHSV